MFVLTRDEMRNLSRIVISSEFKIVVDAIPELMTPHVAAKLGEFGFHTGNAALRRGPAHPKKSKVRA